MYCKRYTVYVLLRLQEQSFLTLGDTEVVLLIGGRAHPPVDVINLLLGQWLITGYLLDILFSAVRRKTPRHESLCEHRHNSLNYTRSSGHEFVPDCYATD